MTALKRLALPAELLNRATEAPAFSDIQHGWTSGASCTEAGAAVSNDGAANHRLAGSGETAAD